MSPPDQTQRPEPTVVSRRHREAQLCLSDVADMSRFGAIAAGGADRLAAAAAHEACRAWFAQWLSQSGFRVTRDRIGNLFGLRALNPAAPCVFSAHGAVTGVGGGGVRPSVARLISVAGGSVATCGQSRNIP